MFQIDALREDLVLVQRDQRCPASAASSFSNRIEFVGRLPANTLCGTQRFQRLAGQALLLELGAHLVGGLAPHQRLGLGEEVREQDRVVLADRVVRLDRREEVARDELRALVDQLVERVLAVGARLAPDDRAGARSRQRWPSRSTLLPLLSMSPCWK